jgi:hypothetical protein
MKGKLDHLVVKNSPGKRLSIYYKIEKPVRREG